MPAKSKKQQQMMAIAEHTPEKLYARNRGALSMSKEELHKFSATKRKGLPLRTKKKRLYRKKK